MKHLQNKMLNTALFLLYGITITALSLRPHIDMGDAPYNDKVAHAVAYGVFTFLAWRLTQSLSGAARQKIKQFLWLALGIFIYSGLIEIAQSYTGRTMSLYDLIANGTGVLLCIIVLNSLKKLDGK